MRGGFDQGRGAIIALPHMANWDLAGAWACLTGMPVSTVAERLRPEALFDRFVAYREGLGMEVIALTGRGQPAQRAAHSIARGRLVCLLGRPRPDRGRPRGRPAGGAGPICRAGRPCLSRVTGAPMVALNLTYRGPLMRLDFSPVIEPLPGPDGLVAMTQQVADWFSVGNRRTARRLAHAAADLQRRPRSREELAVRVGLVCPYSLDVPGGVQNHVRDLAAGPDVARSRGRGPGAGRRRCRTARLRDAGGQGRSACDTTARWRGSHLGPRVARKVRRWVKEGGFDLLHVHEPTTPSVSLIALWSADLPVVATFHTANERSRAMSSVAAVLRPSLEKISARIAVSETARQTLVRHLGGEPVVIPNGIFVDRFAGAPTRAAVATPRPDDRVPRSGRRTA